MSADTPFVYYIISKTKPTQFKYLCSDGWAASLLHPDLYRFSLEQAIARLYEIKSEQTYGVKIKKVTTTLSDVDITVADV